MAEDFDKLMSVFQAALEKYPPEEWDGFVRKAAGDDEELFRKTCQLLQAHANGDSLLDRPVVAASLTLDQPIPAKPGNQLGLYKLLQQIGEGGFGVVFLAEQERPVKRRVALKIIKPGMDTREVIARFEAERQALAMMDHPCIAKVYDAGATANGRPYFVMELVQGVPITEYCDECNLTTNERLELFVTVCQAVQHAHQKGVIHRDIKPTNVLVAIQDGKPSPKIIDFGVAKAINQQLTERSLMTAYAQIIGTPLYMSPEQAELSPLGVDTRSDMYSLGVMLYELLTGTTPFDKDRLHAASYEELRRIIREEEPPRPSARISTLKADLATTVAERRRTDARRLQQSVRGELDWIVMKCLEKDRNRRYESAGSLSRDVERYLHDEPVQACPPSAGYRFRKFVRRNKGPLAASGAIAAALVVGLGISTWLYVRERSAVRTAQLNEVRAVTEATRAQTALRYLQDTIGSADVESGKGVDYTVRELLDDFAAQLEDQFADQPDIEADLRKMIGRAYRSMRLSDKARPHFERVVELRRQLDGRQSPEVAEALVELAWNSSAAGRFHEAEKQVSEALAIYRLRGVTGRPLERALEALHYALDATNRDGEADDIAQQALEVAETDPDQNRLASQLRKQAEMRNRRQRYADAEQLAQKSIGIYRSEPGDPHQELARALWALAYALYGQNKLEQADPALRECLAIFRRYHPEDHFAVRVVLSDLKAVLQERGDYAGLEQLADEAERARWSAGAYDDVQLAGLLLSNSVSNEPRAAAGRQLLRRAAANLDKITVEFSDNLDRRLKVVQGFADIAATCADAPGCTGELNEATRRIDAELPELLAAFPGRDSAITILYMFALVRLQLEDFAGYRDVCAAIAQLPDGIDDYRAEYRRIWALSLGPNALADLPAVRSEVERVVGKYPRWADHRLALGGFLYRLGEYQQAAVQLKSSLSRFSQGWSGESMMVNSQLLLAMTRWRQGEQDEARALLAEIQPAVDDAIEIWSSEWVYRTTAKVLRREAERLIVGGDGEDAAAQDAGLNPARASPAAEQ
jgi:serine/threonine protein kinase/tetratricopeptide (TPR) repeat protein